MSRLKQSLIKLRNSTTVTTAAVLYLSYTAAPLLPAHVGAQRAKVPGFSLLFREATDVHCSSCNSPDSGLRPLVFARFFWEVRYQAL